MHELSGAAEPTQLRFGQPVSCSDGPVGSLSDIVIEPAKRRVSHIVVESSEGAARLVPAELLAAEQTPDGDVVLSCSAEEVLQRSTIRSFSYVGPDGLPRDDDRSDVGVEDMQPVPSFGAVGFDFGAELTGDYSITYDRIPPGSAELRRESIAVSAEGAELGTIDGFLVAGDRLTHVVLHHHATPVPIESVSTIETDHITVGAAESPR